MLNYKGKDITPKMIARVTDHTFLKTEDQGVSHADQVSVVEMICREAHHRDAFSVCVRENMVWLASKSLRELESEVKVCSVIGFPKGDDYTIPEKVELLEMAREDGADEFDMVIPYEALRRRRYDEVYDHVRALSDAAGPSCLKIIFENCVLTLFEKMLAYQTARQAIAASFGPENKIIKRFFKTSTGFGTPRHGFPVGATISDVQLMKQFAGSDIGIKPAGGVTNLEQACAMIAVVEPHIMTVDGEDMIDPYDFRIGASSLLANLYKNEEKDDRHPVQPAY